MSLPQRGYTTGFVPDERDADGKLLKNNDDRTPYQLARFGKGLGVSLHPSCLSNCALHSSPPLVEPMRAH